MAALKRISGIILCVFAILLMSHNTSALSFGGTDTRAFSSSANFVELTNAELTRYQLSGSIINGVMDFNIPTNTKYVHRFMLHFYPQLPSKYLANLSYRFCPRNPDYLSQWIGFGGNAYNSVIQNNYIINGDCINGDVLVYGSTSSYYIYLGANNYGDLTAANMMAGAYVNFNPPSLITLSNDADYSSVLNAIKNNTDDIKDKLDEIKDSADAALDREQSETQDAADDSSTAGSSSSSDATAATSSLISVIGGFVNVLTSAQPTNCKINANLNHIDMGQLDLCANPVPSYIQIIGSIILICAAIPLAIVLFNRFIGLFRSFQG